MPTWWPLLPLALASVAVGAMVRYLPGAGGEVPADGAMDDADDRRHRSRHRWQPGLAFIPAVAMGLGAMTVGMLRPPFTAVLLTTLFLGGDGVTVMPLVIVAVVVAHVLTIRLTPLPADAAPSSPGPPNSAGPPGNG
jgi:hypothetical protein